MRDDDNRHPRTFGAGFSGLLCISSGLVLLMDCLVVAGAEPAAFLFSGAVGAAAIVLMVRRAGSYKHEACELTSGASGNLLLLAVSICMAGAGFVGARLAGIGWATPCIPYVMFLCFFPWSRVGSCHRSPATCVSMLCAGMVAGLVTTDRMPHPVSTAMIVWMLWTGAVFAWLRLVLMDRQQLRSSSAAGPGPTEHPDGRQWSGPSP